MADDPIIQNLITQLGQSQDDRLPAELDAHYIDVDERTADSMVAYTRTLAAAVPFVVPPAKADLDAPAPIAGGWAPLFDQQRTDDGNTAAPLALFVAFLEMYQFPRAAINRITERHLDFLYQRVLGFTPRLATPDRAHAIVVLKKGAPPVRVLPSHLFHAGKDQSGRELLYSPTSDFIVNAARVESLRSVFVDGGDRVLFAPVANSSDGLGAPLPATEPKWHPFGHPGLPVADVGFAVASPILRMKDGHRTISLTLTVDHGESLTKPGLGDVFSAFLTGEKDWLGPFAITATASAGELSLHVDIPAGTPAIVDYDAAIHAHVYTTDAPVLQLIFQPGHGVGYDDVSGLKVEAARITVNVDGMMAPTLESDAGTLDPQKAFLPFGPQPTVGSRFMIGCDEALSKTLSRLELALQWKGAPPLFSTQYQGYTPAVSSNSALTVSAAFRDRVSDHTRTAEPLFDSSDATQRAVVRLIGAANPVQPSRHEGAYVYALSRGRTAWARTMARKMVLRRPLIESYLSHPPETRPGFIVLTLDRSFLHAEYRVQAVAKMLEHMTDSRVPLLKEPYTPTLQSISLSYTAQTGDVRVSSIAAEDFAQLDVQFFHVGPFGQMREHGHQRSALGFVSDTRVPLVPPFEQHGELLIGLGSLRAGDSISVLFQVAEGSADPDRTATAPDWFVLCDNYWKAMRGATDVVRDTTNLLLASGVVTFVLPKEATTENTILPSDLIWIKATVAQHPEGTSQFVDVIANAVELQFVMDSEDAAAAHLTTALPSGSIARPKTPIEFVGSVSQPYPSFDGRPREANEDLRTRAAERIRHKNRGLSPWDYERLVLGKFPSIHRAKCIPHAKPGAWMVPGHVLIVVVPDLRNRHVLDPLQPRVDADTILRITNYLETHAGQDARIAVTNPVYQKVRVSFGVRFRPGYEFNYDSQQLRQRLIEFLSPWAFDASRQVTFGGRVYRSVLLDFVEKVSSVDYVTDFKMFTYTGTLVERRDVDFAEPVTPDAMLVSDAMHDINEVA